MEMLIILLVVNNKCVQVDKKILYEKLTYMILNLF